jgi:hypothetical protein
MAHDLGKYLHTRKFDIYGRNTRRRRAPGGRITSARHTTAPYRHAAGCRTRRAFSRN